jgi:hypothetical protein
MAYWTFSIGIGGEPMGARSEEKATIEQYIFKHTLLFVDEIGDVQVHVEEHSLLLASS